MCWESLRILPRRIMQISQLVMHIYLANTPQIVLCGMEKKVSAWLNSKRVQVCEASNCCAATDEQQRHHQ
jgi:hypothetical protein